MFDNLSKKTKRTLGIIGVVVIIVIIVIIIIIVLMNDGYAPLWYIPDTRRTRALRRYRLLRRWDYPYYKKILDNDPSLFFYDMGHYPF